MRYRLLFLVMAVLPQMGIYNGCNPDATQISYANQWFPYDLKTSRAIQLQGGWRDTLLVGDNRRSWHGGLMARILVDGYGIPESHVSFTLGLWGDIPTEGNHGLNKLVSGAYESLRKHTRVVHIPLYRPFEDSIDVQNVQANPHILFVTGTGNTYIHDESKNPIVAAADNWDVWNPEHPVWRPEIFYPPDLSQAQTVYDNIQALVQSGQVVFATSAWVIENGEVVPDREVMRCGTLKDACFAVSPVQYTSNASARLAAMAFFLAQHYPTTEQVVQVLQECAIDVGEPGVDVEFGHGVATLLCAPVIEKEVNVLLSYSSTPAPRSLRNVLHALRDEPQFEQFVRAAFVR